MNWEWIQNVLYSIRSNFYSFVLASFFALCTVFVPQRTKKCYAISIVLDIWLLFCRYCFVWLFFGFIFARNIYPFTLIAWNVRVALRVWSQIIFALFAQCECDGLNACVWFPIFAISCVWYCCFSPICRFAKIKVIISTPHTQYVTAQ